MTQAPVGGTGQHRGKVRASDPDVLGSNPTAGKKITPRSQLPELPEAFRDQFERQSSWLYSRGASGSACTRCSSPRPRTRIPGTAKSELINIRRTFKRIVKTFFFFHMATP